jgi:hypothetical protein
VRSQIPRPARLHKAISIDPHQPMKTRIATLALVACTALTAFAQAGWNCPVHQKKCPWTRHTGHCAYYDAQPAPKSWVCPMHGKKCPWTKSRGYCKHYDMYGYTTPQPNAPHRGCCWW